MSALLRRLGKVSRGSQVGTGDIKNGAVTSAKIADATIATGDIATNAIDETLMKDAFIGDFTEVTVAAGDSFLLGDADGSGNTKRDTIQGILDLVPSAGFTMGTEQATTSGTSVALSTTIPSGTKQIDVMFDGMSLNGTANVEIQIGDSGGLETTGYAGGCMKTSTGAGVLGNMAAATGFIILATPQAARNYNGKVTLKLEDSTNNVWSIAGNVSADNGDDVHVCGGTKALTATLDRLSIVSTDTFDAGAANIQYI